MQGPKSFVFDPGKAEMLYFLLSELIVTGFKII